MYNNEREKLFYHRMAVLMVVAVFTTFTVLGVAALLQIHGLITGQLNIVRLGVNVGIGISILWTLFGWWNRLTGGEDAPSLLLVLAVTVCTVVVEIGSFHPEDWGSSIGLSLLLNYVMIRPLLENLREVWQGKDLPE